MRMNVHGVDFDKLSQDSAEAELIHRQLAFGGPPRRHGCTRRGKLVRLDPGRGPGTDLSGFALAPPLDRSDFSESHLVQTPWQLVQGRARGARGWLPSAPALPCPTRFSCHTVLRPGFELTPPIDRPTEEEKRGRWVGRRSVRRFRGG